MNKKEELLKSKNFIAFDTETNGMEDTNQFIRISAIKIKNGIVVDKFNQLIKPNIELPSKIEKITKINNKMLNDKPNEKTVIVDFIEWIDKDILVTYNASFEIKYLNLATAKYELPLIQNNVIDIFSLSKKLDKFLDHNIKNLSEKYNIEYNENNREYTIKQLYEKYIDILDNIKVYDLKQLQSLLENKL